MAKARRDLPVIAFKSQRAFEVWLAAQPDNSRGLWLIFRNDQHFQG
jgi:hypothetical protein